jgi:hypothetical protein
MKSQCPKKARVANQTIEGRANPFEEAGTMT